MFWGLIMEPGRCYSQDVKIGFHVSMAAIDISNATNEPTQVMCLYEGRNYLLCTLNKNNHLQCSLDLNFEAGTKVSFATNGNSHVHLTGYLNELDDDDDVFDDEEQEEEEAETNSLVNESEIEDLIKDNLGIVDKKRKKQLNNSATKKAKLNKSDQAVSSTLNKNAEDEDDSSDSDFDLNKMMEDSDEDDGVEEEEDNDDDDVDAEEEDDDEDEDNDDVEEEEDDDEDEEEEEESENETPVIKQNGLPKKAKKNKQQQTEVTTPGKKQQQQQQQTPKSDKKPKKQVLKGGLIIEELKEGNGDVVKAGKFVHVHYEGRLKSNNKVFDSTTKGPGFSFRLGKGEVIKGWDLGIVGMKVGGKRRIICPPSMAYGPKGSPPVIPPNATLVFDVEVKKMN